MAKSLVKNWNQWISAAGLAACLWMSVWLWQKGLLSSEQALRDFLGPLGPAAALAFVAFQAVQVVVPILPGGLGCLAGVLLFGAVNGFVYNYIGICVGSLMAFAIARSCGKPLLPLLFSEKTIAKYSAWTEDRGRFSKLFAWAIFLPLAPDDFLCYLAGTTEMTWRRFTAIILLGKPFAIAMYSLGLTVIWQRLVAVIA